MHPTPPYDDTRFAPITRFGPSISIEVVAEGDPDDSSKRLTSPLKGDMAPGLRNHLFVVDQVGIRGLTMTRDCLQPAQILASRAQKVRTA